MTTLSEATNTSHKTRGQNQPIDEKVLFLYKNEFLFLVILPGRNFQKIVMRDRKKPLSFFKTHFLKKKDSFCQSLTFLFFNDIIRLQGDISLLFNQEHKQI